MKALAMAGALALAALACGCAPQPVPPLLTLTGRTCDTVPVLDGAQPVPFGEAGGVAVTLDAASRCLDADGGRTVTYAVFRLPDGPAPFQVTISSDVVSGNVVAPRATVLDGGGSPRRVLATDGFRSGLSGFVVGLRAQAADRFIVVAADPATVGEHAIMRLSEREGWVRLAATIIIIPAVVPVVEQQRQNAATFALNGRVRVSAMPVTTVP